MGLIIRMDSAELINEFIGNANVSKYEFLVVSSDITTNNKLDNVTLLTALIPPPNAMSEFISRGNTARYKELYLEYLMRPQIETLITSAVQHAVLNDANIIFVCSSAEAEYKYLKMLCKYIELGYGVKTYSFAKFKDNPNGCVLYTDKKAVLKSLASKTKNASASAVPEISKKDLLRKLKDLSKEELMDYCKSQKIKLKGASKKKEIIERITKKTL